MLLDMLKSTYMNNFEKKYNLVILHGWMHNKTLWQGLVEKFSDLPEINKVYVPNLPGFGDEPALDEKAGVLEYTKWTINYIETKMLDNVVLLGHSFGGRIIAEIASKNPKWLEAIILYGAPCIYRPKKELKLRIKLNSILGKFIPISLKPKILKIITKGEDLNTVVGTKMETTFRKSIVFDQTDQLKQILCKTYLVVGEYDPEVRADMITEMVSLIGNAESVVVPHVSHNIHIENPNLFYGTIKTIIQNL
jgi:pimeloyl-ACP methyl ester carboxylesterase